jgi:hypothetical protein
MTTIVETIREAMTRPCSPERAIGCCRVYVSIVDATQARGVAHAAKVLNMRWQKRSHYGDSNALYIGYDNCDGQALARGAAVVEALKAAGINCHRNEHGD